MERIFFFEFNENVNMIFLTLLLIFLIVEVKSDTKSKLLPTCQESITKDSENHQINVVLEHFRHIQIAD